MPPKQNPKPPKTTPSTIPHTSAPVDPPSAVERKKLEENRAKAADEKRMAMEATQFIIQVRIRTD